MQTALDTPASELSDDQKTVVDAIRGYGWFRTSHAPQDGYPGFAYTTGFWLNLGFPELIVFSLPEETAHAIFLETWNDIKAGNRPPVGQAAPLLGSGNAWLAPVQKSYYDWLMETSHWFYGGDDFRCVQLVWPDQAGVFPWQPGFDQRLLDAQPNLTDIKAGT
ncbi:MAG: DUF4262 domain-containing protein [Asticcacaulis sp.]|nr:DUF4262 domain-containing protein [Asticcacaulis sp.]